ncbi:MAG: flagellar hook-associated protein FlgL [Bacteriovoracia bacterium]
MRVTQNTSFNTVRDTVHKAKSRMEKFQNQASTMKKLNVPSDNPIGSAKVLEVRTDKVNNDQYLANAKLAEAFLNNADHALDDLSEVVMRAKEIAIGQASGASSTDETRLGVAEEVNQLFKRAVADANTKIGDRYLFSGYKTHRPSVNEDGQFVGDDGQMMVEIGKDVFISMNVPGIEAFNTNPKTSADFRRLKGVDENGEPMDTGDSARAPATTTGGSLETSQSLSPMGEQNANVFNELQNLRIALLTGDLGAIRDTLERFDQIHANIVATRSRVGSRVQGLQGSLKAMERHNLTNAELTSQLEDADMAHVMTEIAKEESVLNSVLSSSKRLVQPTLMDFLR